MRLYTLSLALVTLALATACTAPVGKEPTGSESSHQMNDNVRTAYRHFISDGFTDSQAAAIVGNLQQESSPALDPAIHQHGGGPGRGIGQWEVGHRSDHDAGDNVQAFAAQQHASATSLDLQLRFVSYELQHFSYYGGAAVRATNTLESAVTAFQRGFERCSACDPGNRLQYARDVLAQLGNGSRGQSPPSTGGGTPKTDPGIDDTSPGEEGGDDGSGKPAK